jgi:hypothetical protein
VQPSEVLFGRPVLIECGSFRPITNVTLDMLVRAEQQLQEDSVVAWEPPVIVMEMTLNNLTSDPAVDRTIDHGDFLSRVDMLGVLGKFVMVSNYTRFDKVTTYLRTATKNWIGMVVGMPTLEEIFQEKYYSDLDGGMLEGLGRLFQGAVRLLVYPTRTTPLGDISTAETFAVDKAHLSLYAYFLQNGLVQPIRHFDAAQLHLIPGEVLRKLQSSDPTWEAMVPPEVALFIKQHGLFSV